MCAVVCALQLHAVFSCHSCCCIISDVPHSAAVLAAWQRRSQLVPPLPRNCSKHHLRNLCAQAMCTILRMPCFILAVAMAVDKIYIHGRAHQNPYQTRSNLARAIMPCKLTHLDPSFPLTPPVCPVLGIWSQIKRAPQAVKKRKTFEVPGPAVEGAMPLDARARQIFR